MRLPFTVDDRDVVVELADGDVTVGETVAAAGGDPRAVRAGGRPVEATTAFLDARLRPGDRLTTAHEMPSGDEIPAGALALHVVAGIDAGLVVAVPAANPVPAPRRWWHRLLRRPKDPPTPGPSHLTVGRAADSTVRLHSPAVSSHHCTLIVGRSSVDDEVEITVVDTGSRNGTLVRGRRVGTDPVAVAVGEPIRCGPALLTVRPIPPTDTPRSVATALAEAPTGPVPFYRSPVDLAPDPGPLVVAPAAPRRPRTGRPGLVGFLLPLAMAGALVYFTGQVMYALFALMAPVMMVVTTIDRANRNRRTRRRSRRRYREEMAEFRVELDDAVAEEVRRRRAISPDLAELRRRSLAASASLWSRRRGHPQFLTLALGMADLEWSPPVEGTPDDVDDLQAAVRAAAVLPHVPLTVDATAGTVLGLAGERAAAVATARGLLVQVAALHGPAEVRVVLVTGRDGEADWEWAKWLPHLRPTFAEGRLLAIVADGQGLVEGTTIDEVLADLDAGAAVVAVIDTVGLADAGDVAVRRLLRRGDSLTTGIVLAPTTDGLPDQCDVVVDHHAAIGEATCRWPREGGRTLELVTGGATTGVAAAIAGALARFSDPDAGGGSAALPARIGLAEVLGLVDASPTDVQARWADAGPLRAVAGVGDSGAVVFDLDAHGPHAVIVGGRGAGKTEHLAALVLGLTASQPPERLHLVLWGESFGHLHRLPHVASRAVRIEEGVLNQFIDGLDRELARRERRRTQRADGEPGDEARLAVVIDDVDTIMRVLPKAGDDLIRVLRRARGLGVHVLWSTSRASGGVMTELVDLSTTRVVLRLSAAPESNDLLGSDAAARLERSLPGRGYLAAGRADPREVQGGSVSVGAPRPSGRLEVAPFALAGGRDGLGSSIVGPPDERALVSLISAAGASSTRPADLLVETEEAAADLLSPGLLDLLGVGEEGLNTVTERWHTIDGEGFLRVPIGVDPELRPVPLDIKESALNGMGPHGLLVGATGSGKSELLRTLVGGLALTHAPEALAFVLVDFKGGASFATLGRLPHVAGVVTNLADDLALVDRILAALGGEQKRRQELLARAGNLGNVRDYRSAHRAGTLPSALADEPLPELLIVVDEFAELLDQEPAFIDFFLTIGRVGRSLGIHLLLASQRLEEGKLRGLDTYLSYRLGLRTFSAAESRIVLGVPDAYALPNAPGGGYLKVGSTSYQRFQAAYVSGPTGVLDSIVERLADAAPKVHQIWLDPMPEEIPLDQVFGRGFVHDPERGFAAAGWPRAGRLAAPIGIVDEPEMQRQLPLIVDFAGAHGNLAVAGAPQTGKSVLLRSAILALAVTHTAAEVQVYAVDLGGGTLDTLAELPHVGAVATRRQPELVRRLVAHVEDTLARREALFHERSIDSAATFRQLRRDGELPDDVGGDVFLVIDGWAAFREQFENLEPVIADLASRGLGYGVHVVISLNRWMEMRAVVLDAIGGRLELRLNSAVDSVIDRRRAAVIRADQPGRGLHPSTRLFQVALPRLDGVASGEQLAAATKVAVGHVASRWDGGSAAPVRLLPRLVRIDELDETDETDETPGVDPGGGGVPVGLTEQGLATWRFDLTGSEPHFFVFGDGESGKTTFLHTWLTQLTARVGAEAAQIALVDYRRTLLEVVPDEHLRAYAASEPAAREVIEALATVALGRLPGAEVTAAQLRDRSWWSGPELYVVVDDYDLVLTPTSNPLTPLLGLLAQGRDIGLHLVLSRRVAGAAKAMYEPITARMREVSATGLVLSGDRDEGPLLGPVRATDQPPGRGVLVTRRRPPTLVQVAVS
ncbi:MAG: type VII secretion protein EccCb [Desertimonas sp.]